MTDSFSLTSLQEWDISEAYIVALLDSTDLCHSIVQVSVLVSEWVEERVSR